MKEQYTTDKTTLQQAYEWNNPVQTQAYRQNNLYSLGTNRTTQKLQVFKKMFCSPRLSKQNFIRRKRQLEQLQHQNYVPVQYKQVVYKEIGNNKFIKRFNVISPYIQSISLSNFIKQQRNLYQKDFFNIIQQVVNVMSLAENKQIYHYHLNQNSILLIENDNQYSSEFFVKVCDWGYGNEIFSPQNRKKEEKNLKKFSKTSMFQYLHPQILFGQGNQQFYHSYESKHDIWSFGVILYRLRTYKRPFSNKGSFCPQTLEKYNKNIIKLQFQKQGLLASMISRMLSIKGFESWSQIKHFLIQKAERSQSDFLGIRVLHQKQSKLINYMIQIYKLIAWSINNSANCFWFQNKHIMKKSLFYMMKLMHILQKVKFIQRFGHRMNQLSEAQKCSYKQLSNIIQAEWNRICELEPMHIQSLKLFDILDKLKEYLLAIQLRMDGYESTQSQAQRSSLGARIRQTWSSMKSIKKFSSQMLQIITGIQNYNRNVFESFYFILKSV